MHDFPLFSLLPIFLAVAIPTQAQAQADLVVFHANIYTVNPAQPQAEALAVAGDRIVMVGTNEEVLAAYPEAERVDAEGQTLIPGLIDAHAHLMGLGLGMMQAELVGMTSKADILDRLKAFEASLAPDDWLLGRGWDQNDWPEKAFPTHKDLDEAFPSRPVWLRRVDGHAGWANTAALRIVGMERLNTLPDPEGGKIHRDEAGQPTGIFVDAAMGLVNAQVPPFSRSTYEQALQRAIAETSRLGLTGVHDAGIGLETIRGYQQAIDQGRFDLRLYGMVDGDGAAFNRLCQEGMVMHYGNKLTVRAVKLYIDGALGSRGAALLEDYSDDPGNRGLLMKTPEDFTATVKKAVECGFQVNTHAIGDQGNRVVLDAYEQALQGQERGVGRHRIEHAQVVTLEDIPRFASLGIIASMQPTHGTSDMYWAEDRVGPERIQGAYAWRTFLDQGVPLAFGSDFPVEQVDPLLGFYAAITRQDAEGWPEGGWYPAQNLTRAEALHAFTLGAAYAAFQEEDLGSLEPGKYADFVLLSQDIMTIPPTQILATTVVATYLGGKKIYAAP